MTEAAISYFKANLSVIPTKEDKRPAVKSWTQNQKTLIAPNGEFEGAYGIGIITGLVSGNAEALDFDTKYDVTGTLFARYKEAVKIQNKELLKKMVVQQTQSGGFHFLYRCSKIEGNQKLASRHTTQEERAKNPNDKLRVLIETRGEGGFVVACPTPKYKLLYGKFEELQEITEEEREILISIAKSFNEVWETPVVRKEYQQTFSDQSSPIEDYQVRADVVAEMENHGWKVTGKHGENIHLLRPGGTGKISGSYHVEKRIFFCFSTSTQFDGGKGYNPFFVYSILNYGGNHSEAAKKLLELGYGQPLEKKKKDRKPKTKIIDHDQDYSFVATKEETDDYIKKIREGSFQMGLPTGWPELDAHWRLKAANLVMILGMDNVGKSVLTWAIAAASAKLHDWKWIIFVGENKVGAVKRKIIEYYTNTAIDKLAEDQLEQASGWFDAHFTLLRNKEVYNYMDILAMGKKLLKKQFYNAILVDPYNSLERDCESASEHSYDYRAMSELRVFIEQTGVGIYLPVHAVTEALRRKYPKGHRYEGYPMPPDKSDAEGGGKFANKADDFLVFHRLPQHPNDWMNMEIHVKKIKEMETGGRHTALDTPVILRMVNSGTGYEDSSGNNPMVEKKQVIVRNWTEPKNEEYDF